MEDSPQTQQDITVLKEKSRLEQEKIRRLQILNDIEEENKTIRRCLIIFLSILSSAWLIFTGYEIRQIAKMHHFLPNNVSIAFITSSLATVVGLWAIGLKYFFNHKNK
ncbi:MAG: hypothetical protein PUB86_07310 [Elusimicrobia bacterium]|nr:hypothetical protein [Elusimicrobiota bacterium]